MAKETGISWTDHTFNPWWGCVKVSPACTSCYAERDAKRYGHDVWGPSARRRFFTDKHWQEPFKWNAAAEQAGERRRVFCASMADLFEVLPEGHPDIEQMAQERERLFRHVIPATPHLDWLILTKRPAAMARYFAADGAPLSRNIVVMTTAENQEWFDKRINQLLETRALRRGLSLEPLLGAIDLWPMHTLRSCAACWRTQPEADLAACAHCGSKDLQPAISWVITGGESGPKARPTHPDWVRALRDQCAKAGIPFHHKQWGEWMPFPTNTIPFPPETVAEIEAFPPSAPVCLVKADGRVISPYAAIDGPGKQMVRVGKKKAGRLLDGFEWNDGPLPLPLPTTKEQA